MKKSIIFIVWQILLLSWLVFSQEVIENRIELSRKLKASDVWLEKELEIGGQKQEGEYLFEDIRSFRVDEEGNIYVIDVKAKKLMKFDKQGKLVWKIGKTGQGPGEFQVLSGIELGKSNTLLLYDLGNRRISYYSLEGGLKEEISVANKPIIHRVDDDSKGNLYVTIIIYEETIKIKLLNKFDNRLNIAKEIYRKDEKFLPKEVNFYPIHIHFRVRSDDLITYANSWEYVIYLADGEGKVKKIIRNKYKPVKYTEADKKRDFSEVFSDRTPSPEIKFIFPDYYPPIEHLLIDDQDNIFVRTYERTKDGAYYYDYFDAEGRYIASFPMKETIFCIRGERFYTLEEDEEGYQKIVRYRYRLKLR